MQKSELKNLRGGVRQHSAQKSCAEFQEEHLLQREVIPTLVSHMVIYCLLSISHLFSATESFTLLLHWSLALPSFEFNTIFPLFTDNLTLSTASRFCGCVYKLCLVTASFAAGQKTAHDGTITTRKHITWRFWKTGSLIQTSVQLMQSDISTVLMNHCKLQHNGLFF